MENKLPKLWLLVILMVLSCLVPAKATDYVWTGGGGDQDWTNNNNWHVGGSHPDDNGDTATFNATFIGDCDVPNNIVVGQVNVSEDYIGIINLNSASFTIDDAGTENGEFYLGSEAIWNCLTSTFATDGDSFVNGTFDGGIAKNTFAGLELYSNAQFTATSDVTDITEEIGAYAFRVNHGGRFHHNNGDLECTIGGNTYFWPNTPDNGSVNTFWNARLGSGALVYLDTIYVENNLSVTYSSGMVGNNGHENIVVLGDLFVSDNQEIRPRNTPNVGINVSGTSIIDGKIDFNTNAGRGKLILNDTIIGTEGQIWGYKHMEIIFNGSLENNGSIISNGANITMGKASGFGTVYGGIDCNSTLNSSSVHHWEINLDSAINYSFAGCILVNGNNTGSSINCSDCTAYNMVGAWDCYTNSTFHSINGTRFPYSINIPFNYSTTGATSCHWTITDGVENFTVPCGDLETAFDVDFDNNYTLILYASDGFNEEISKWSFEVFRNKKGGIIWSAIIGVFGAIACFFLFAGISMDRKHLPLQMFFLGTSFWMGVNTLHAGVLGAREYLKTPLTTDTLMMVYNIGFWIFFAVFTVIILMVLYNSLIAIKEEKNDL